MAQASLLSRRDPWFAFEHAMAHRDVIGIIRTVHGLSIVPYFIEPEQGVNRHANKWHLDHQQAHDDLLKNLPTKYYWQPPPPPLPPPAPPPVPTVVTFGLKIGTDLIDTSMADERQRRWWEFENHMEHYVASQMIAPAPAPKPAPQWKYPFW